MSYELELFHRDISDAEILQDLVNAAQRLNKRRITFRDYNEVGKFSASTVSARFGTWLAALRLVGLEADFNRNIASDELFQNLVNVWANVGRQPRFRDMNGEISKYSASTYSSRFGSWHEALQEFVKWAKESNLDSILTQSGTSSKRQTPRNVSWRLRALVLMRDGATCRLCGDKPQLGAILEVDHIHPWSKGGETSIGNLQILCQRCNGGKSNIVI